MIVDGEGHARPGFGGLREFFRLILRHKLLVLVPTIVGIVGGCLIFANTPGRYVATAVVALDVRKVTVVPIDAVVSRLPQENPALRTEIDVLSSRSMAERVIDQLGMEALSPLLHPTPTGRQRLTGSLTSLGRELRQAVRPSKPRNSLDAPAPPPSPTEEQVRQELVDRLMGGLQISNDGRSYTIHISYSANDPKFAAMIANSYAEAYFAHQATLKLNAIRTASEWLGKKVNELRASLESAERAVEAFKQEAGLLKIGDTSVGDRRLDALNTELVRARASVAEARARLETASGQLRSIDGLAAFSEALASPIILALREQQAALLREQEALQDAGALKSERLPAIESQLRALQGQINREVDRVLEALRNEVLVAERREAELQDIIRTEMAASGAADAATVHLNQLEREAAASRALYETFLGRYKAIIEQEDLASPEGQLISAAQPPTSPATPKLLPLLALGCFLGAGTGIGAACLREHMDDRIWSAASLEERTELPVLGALPARHWWTELRRRYGRTRTATCECDLSLQRLQAVLRLSLFSRGAKVIALASAERGEGKSFVSIALAKAFAATGESVLVLDADLHRPSIAARLGVNPSFNWEQVLAGEKSIDDIVQRDAEGKISIVAGEPSPVASMTLFTAPAFQALISGLRGRYDRVIIDTPPVSAFPDAAMMGAAADMTLMIVRWRVTTYTAVVEALRQMALCSVPVAGIVLNQLDVRSSARYAPRPTRPEPPGFARAGGAQQGRQSPPRLTSVAGGLDRPAPPPTEES